MKLLYFPDVNEGGGSSAPPKTDVKPVETPSSSVSQGVKDQTFDQAADAIADKAIADGKEKAVAAVSPPADITGQGEPKAPSGDVQTLNPTEEKEPSEGKKEDKKVEDEALPFGKHPRFQEILRENKEYKQSFEQMKNEVVRLKNIDDFCAANSINDQQFKDFIEITALVNSNPQEALKRLKPLIEHLGGFEGEVLPPDLAAEVEQATISPQRAKEIASLRKQKEFIERRSTQTQAQAVQQATFEALMGWVNTTKAKDVEYARKEPQVQARFSFLASQNPPRSGREAVALAQQAYDDVNAFISGFVPKVQPAQKSLNTNGSVSVPPKEASTWDEAVEEIADKYSSR